MTNRLRLGPQIHFCTAVIVIPLLALPAIAQQDQAPAQPAPSQQQSQQGEPGKDGKDKDQTERTSPSNDRLFFVLPTNLTVKTETKVPRLPTQGNLTLAPT